MRNRRGSIFEAVVTDGRGKLTLTFFGKGRQDWRERQLAPGLHGLFSGQVSTFRGKRQLSHPEYELIGLGAAGSERAVEFASELIPIYPASKDIASWQIADSVRLALAAVEIDGDPLPAQLRARHKLQGYARALQAIHRPADAGDYRAATAAAEVGRGLHAAGRAGAAQADVHRVRRAAAARRSPAACSRTFDGALPFELTPGQQAAGTTIAADLAREHPMHRLLQGEVGSGKTIVALRAMLQVIDAAGQAALLAPTEVLAQQHHRSISQMLGPLAMAGQLGGAEHATRVTLLTGSQPAAARSRALLEAASGEAGIVIGTHALLEEHVQFADLGLVVIDEQHRFGVEQREALRGKAADGRPHVLVMTATPIPRTVAMTVFGDLEVTELTELPAGRVADRHACRSRRREAALPRQDLGAGRRGGQAGQAGLRRVPADRRAARRPARGQRWRAARPAGPRVAPMTTMPSASPTTGASSSATTSQARPRSAARRCRSSTSRRSCATDHSPT